MIIIVGAASIDATGDRNEFHELELGLYIEDGDDGMVRYKIGDENLQISPMLCALVYIGNALTNRFCLLWELKPRIDYLLWDDLNFNFLHTTTTCRRKKTKFFGLKMLLENGL